MNVVCTVIIKNLLPQARVLAHSLRVHNPDMRLIVLLGDRLNGEFDPTQEPFDLIHLEDLDDDGSIERMSFYYKPYDFCCALRGFLHHHLISRTSFERWLYLDPETVVHGPLDPLLARLDNQSVLLACRPMPPQPEGQEATHADLLRRGGYSSRLLGLRRSEPAARFAQWFRDRLQLFCSEEVGLYRDQRWLLYVPVYFPPVQFVRERDIVLEPTSLRRGALDRSGETLRVDGVPLTLMHMGDLRGRTDRMTDPVLREMTQAYEQMLQAHGAREANGYTYGFDRLKDGTIIPRAVRDAYNLMCRVGWRPTQSPWDPTVWSPTTLADRRSPPAVLVN